MISETVETASTEASVSVASIRNLHVSMSRHGVRSDVVRGVDLDIRAGEILGLVGESGSGKSVLSLALLGLLPASADPRVTGHVSVGGVDMATGPRRASAEAARRQVRRLTLGAVFQDPMTSLNPTMRIGDQVQEAAGSAAEAVRLMRAVGIPQPERRFRAYPHELSGGLRQRVMIAMAIAGGPKLVIADEPTTALDVTVQAQVLSVLRALRDDIGCSILMITHDLGVAGQLADRIAVMYAGRLAEVGATEDVLTRPRHPYTSGLLGSQLDLSTDRRMRLRTLAQDVAPKEQRDQGCAYHTRCPIAVERCAEETPSPVVLDAGAPSPAGAEPVEHRSACHLPDRTPDGPAQTPTHLHPDPDSRGKGAGGVGLALTEVRCEFPVRDERGRKAILSALRGVTLDVRAGESLALVGESGSGKSTLLRVVAGLQRSYTGTVEGPSRDRVQMVFQDAGASLTPWLRVEELLAERLAGRGLGGADRRRRVLEALDAVGLPEATAAARPSELSGGQRQRVVLARATIVPPEILLCDEPTSALDVSLAATVLNLIQQLRRDLGMTIVFVTHDLAVARIVGDRIAVMYLGRIVELGPADEVIADPKHPYTRALISAVPSADKSLPEIVGEPASPLAPPPGCAYHPRCPVALQDCSATLTGIQLVPIGPRPPSNSDRAARSVACVHRGAA